ncbi:MAG: hypothetical protein FJ197_05645 [Gammaproteobacteria bacterium]|nr:hypothetical protein [Gammaproteobacteria bacterium]
MGVIERNIDETRRPARFAGVALARALESRSDAGNLRRPGLCKAILLIALLNLLPQPALAAEAADSPARDQVSDQSAAPHPADPALAALVRAGQYDRQLCALAQRVLVNAGSTDFLIRVLNAKGGSFITEQMDVDAATGTVTVAALAESVEVSGRPLAVAMACKLVNQDRVNDVLGLRLTGRPGSCRDVNELTYQLALAGLLPEARATYLARGRALRFIDDYKAAAGGEWLPSVISDFIKATAADGESPGYLTVQAPSVQVPWQSPGGDWFQGTHHCKLISVAAMTRWMTDAALGTDSEMFPRPRPVCVTPSSRQAAAGSCLLYFGPANAQFCQDYSGTGWTEASARADCAIRHSSKTAWNAASDRYGGDGGSYDDRGCADRGVLAEARKPPVDLDGGANRGTCVFRCNTPDEALWHQLSAMPGDADGRMLERTCDLFLEPYW